MDLYLREILNDLLKNLTSNQWRIRESSCNAVTDLLRGRQLDSIVDSLPELWEQCLRVRDDIKVAFRVDVTLPAETTSLPCLTYPLPLVTPAVASLSAPFFFALSRHLRLSVSFEAIV